MKVCLSLICLFFLTLQDGDAERCSRGKERENITVGCKFLFPGRIKFFCKGICEGENILVETSEDTAQSGRYNIEYKTYDSGSYVLYVSISKLKRSDAGRYRCGLDNPGVRYDDFKLIVTGASKASGSIWALKTFQTALVTSPPVTRAATMKEGLQLYVILSLVAKIILLSTPLVIFCWKRRTMKSKDSAGETENADVSQINPERKEIPEGRQNNSSADEIISVYS